jgi:hypothetical protein
MIQILPFWSLVSIIRPIANVELVLSSMCTTGLEWKNDKTIFLFLPFFRLYIFILIYIFLLKGKFLGTMLYCDCRNLISNNKDQHCYIFYIISCSFLYDETRKNNYFYCNLVSPAYIDMYYVT